MKLLTTCWTFDEFEDSEVYRVHTQNPYTNEKEVIRMDATETILAIVEALREFCTSKKCVLLNDGSIVFYGDHDTNLERLKSDLISWGEMTINTVLCELEEEYWHNWEKENNWHWSDKDWTLKEQCYDVCF